MFAAAYAGAKEALGAARIGSWKPILWAMIMAVGIEMCLLSSPYATFFGIHMNTRFVVVTLTAHVIFGLGLGAYFAWHAGKWRLPGGLAASAPA
jgi:hypothetical protein